MIVLADARGDVADYVYALFLVYTILVVAWVLSQLFLSFNSLPTYNRALIGLLDFLQQTVAPFLAFFRRFIPQLGPLDLSPFVALIVLQVLGRIVVQIIRG